jgi:hypothetical protein
MGRGREGEIYLIKNNMSWDDDVVGGEIETPISFVIGRVSEENTSGGPRCQFVSCFGGEIGIAGTTEYVQLLIRGSDFMKGEVWTGRADRLGGEPVQQICGGAKPFYPVVSRNRSLKEQGAQHIINGVNDALGFTILWRIVWIRHPQNHPFSGEECTRWGVVEPMAIVALDNFDGAAKLCGDISKKNWQSGKGVRFNAQRKSTHKMGVIIKDNQITFITRYANNWRGSHITMY